MASHPKWLKHGYTGYYKWLTYRILHSRLSQSGLYQLSWQKTHFSWKFILPTHSLKNMSCLQPTHFRNESFIPNELVSTGGHKCPPTAQRSQAKPRTGYSKLSGRQPRYVQEMFVKSMFFRAVTVINGHSELIFQSYTEIYPLRAFGIFLFIVVTPNLHGFPIENGYYIIWTSLRW